MSILSSHKPSIYHANVLQTREKTILAVLMPQFAHSGWRTFARALRVVALGAVTAAACAPVFASLGEARLQTALGQPLRALIPTSGLSIDELEPRCLRLFRPASNDGVPVPQDIYLEFQDFGTSRRVTARTRSSVQEPAIRFGIELSCGQSVKREYILLLDPLPVADTTSLANPPVIEGAPIGEAPVIVSRPTRRPPAQTANNSGFADDVPPPPPRRKVAKRKPVPALTQGSVEIPAAKNSTRDTNSRLSIRGGAEGLSRDLDLSAMASPRLRFAQSLSSAGLSTAPITDVDRAVMAAKRARLLNTPIDTDLRPQLEVDLMIAQKRIGELQARLAAADPKAAAAVSAVVYGVTNTASPSADASVDVPKVPASMTAPLPEAAAPVEPQKPIAPKAVSREKQPVGGNFSTQLLSWIWVPALLALFGAGAAWTWLGKKRRQEEQDRAYAAAAAAVGLSPDIGNDQAMGGFVDTRMRSMGSLTRPKGSGAGGSSNKGDGDTVRKVVSSMSGTSAEVRGSPMDGLTTIKVHGGRDLGALDLTSDLFQPNFDTDKLGVSMVSAVTEEASVYVELGRVPEAIGVLKDHIDLERAYNRATPAPWLMLLDLYHREDNRAEFDRLRNDFIKNFNGRIPEWGAFNDSASDKSLLEHDHIVERLVRYWASPKCHQYIQKLLYDHRDNSRIGFSLTAYRELVLLDSIHVNAFPSDDEDKPIVFPDQV
jgi:hypothetical protein